MQSEDVMNESQCATMLGVPQSTLRVWRKRGDGPPSTRAGRAVLYLRRSVLEWLDTKPPAPIATLPPAVQSVLGNYMTEQQFASMMSISERTAVRWRLAKSGPVHTRLGRAVYYSIEDVTAWAHGMRKP